MGSTLSTHQQHYGESLMSTLASLKLVSAQKPISITPTINRRNNLSTQLFHQIELAKALSENRQYTPTTQKVIKDKITGEKRTVEKAIRLKQMWWTTDNKVYLQVKYSNKVLELSKGKNSVEVSSPTELINAEATESLKSDEFFVI
jgi:hypothetical protein